MRHKTHYKPTHANWVIKARNEKIMKEIRYLNRIWGYEDEDDQSNEEGSEE